MVRVSRLQQLKDAWFDLSEAVPFERAWRVRCSNCAACTINGVPCHERGCPNERRARAEAQAREEEEDAA